MHTENKSSMKRLILTAVTALFAIHSYAQNADSLALVNASWTTTRLGLHATASSAHVYLFENNQFISLIKFPVKRHRMRIIQHSKFEKVSETATKMEAKMAINAGYWNMKKRKASTYVRIDGQDLSSTEQREVFRVDGAVTIDDRDISIIPCDSTCYSALAMVHDNILACGPVLIHEGKSRSFKGQEKTFFWHHHPRSVIGKDDKGYVYLLVVDGRFNGLAVGMTCDELTSVCRWLGMTEALNLDGGGSSTLWSSKTGVLNHPYDNHRFDNTGERRVSSCILIY